MTVTSTIGARVEDIAGAGSTLALVTSDGTPVSWGEVFDEYAPALRAYARSRGVREPEDLVQDVFVAAVERLPGFVGDRSGLRSLLFTIAYRRIADEHRRFYRRPETLVAEHSPRPDPGPTVEEVIGRGESAGQAIAALAVLTERERQVIQMRVFQEAPPAKVGEALGLSSANVRVIQARALAKIRTHLTSVGERGFAHPIITIGTLADFVRCLRTQLPAHGVLGTWVEEMRSGRSAHTIDGSAMVGGASIVQGSSAATERATETTYSLISTIISSGAARFGAVAAIVALSTVPVVPALLTAGVAASPLDKPDAVVEDREATPVRPFEPVDDAPGESAESLSDHPGTDPPAPLPPGAIRATVRSDQVPDEDAAQSDGLPTAGLTESPDQSTPDLVNDVVGPLWDDVVEPVLDDVVTPLVDEVVEPLVEDTVELVVDDVLTPVVDEVVEPLVDDSVEPLVDDVVTGPGGLLGGRLTHSLV